MGAIPVSGWGDGSGLDKQMAVSLRSYLQRADRASTEALATRLSSYMRAYLTAYLRRRRFGFDGPIAEVAVDVADSEIPMLIEEGQPDRLIEGIRRFLSPVGRPASERSPIEDASDDALVAAAKLFLRLRCRQGAILLWKQEHPEEARILRSVKAAIADTPGISLRQDACGQRLVSPRSDLRLPPFDTPRLVTLLGRVPPPYCPRAVLRALIPQLHPTGDSGGYCFLMDLVRANHLLRLSAIAGEASGTGAAPIEAESLICGDGVPFAVKLARLTLRLSQWAEESLTADAEKHERLRTRRGVAGTADPGPDPRVIAIAIDRILAPVGLGRPEWAELSLEGLVATAMATPEGGRNNPAQVHQIDYLIRRLRTKMRAHWRELI